MYEAKPLGNGVWRVTDSRGIGRYKHDPFEVLTSLEEWQAIAIAAILNGGPSWNGGNDEAQERTNVQGTGQQAQQVQERQQEAFSI